MQTGVKHLGGDTLPNHAPRTQAHEFGSRRKRSSPSSTTVRPQVYTTSLDRVYMVSYRTATFGSRIGHQLSPCRQTAHHVYVPCYTYDIPGTRVCIMIKEPGKKVATQQQHISTTTINSTTVQ